MFRDAGRLWEVKLRLCLTCNTNLIQNSQNGATVIKCINPNCSYYNYNVIDYKEKDDGKSQENPLP